MSFAISLFMCKQLVRVEIKTN